MGGRLACVGGSLVNYVKWVVHLIKRAAKKPRPLVSLRFVSTFLLNRLHKVFLRILLAQKITAFPVWQTGRLYTLDPAFMMSDNYNLNDAMDRSSPLSPCEVPITRRPEPFGRDYTVLPPVQGLDRRPSKSLPGLEQIRTLPSIPSLQSPQSLWAATFPEFGYNNSRVLPPIQSALARSLPNAFPLYPYPDRQIPQFLPQASPGPFSHLSTVSTENASKELFPAMAAVFSPPCVMSYTTSMSPSYLMTRYQVSSGPGSEEPVSFSSPPSANMVPATNSYKCTPPGRTAVPFQPQSLINCHANVHSQNKIYRCPIETCPWHEKGFERNDGMNRHFRTHQLPSYRCPLCGNMYARSDTLQRHVRDQHHDKNKKKILASGKRYPSNAMTAQDIDIREREQMGIMS